MKMKEFLFLTNRVTWNICSRKMMNEMQFLCNKFRISEETFASDFIKEISHAWGNISSDMLDQALSKYFYSVIPEGCVKKIQE